MANHHLDVEKRNVLLLSNEQASPFAQIFGADCSLRKEIQRISAWFIGINHEIEETAVLAI